MRIDEARVALRARSALEAVDWGFAMARRWWRPLATTWLGLVAPLAAALIWALRDHPFWALFALWWLRPVFARVPLHVLAREIFGETATLAETARALPGLVRGGLFTALVSQRLSPARAMLLPVIQLEGLRGPARRARCAVLAERDTGTAMGLAAVAAHMNASILIGLVLALALALPDPLAPQPLELLPAFFDGGGGAASWLWLPALYFAGTSVVEPLLTAGGFGLYLNRRVILEGWDLELAFRRLARRLGGFAHAAALAALAALLLMGAAPLRAAEPEACAPDRAESARACAERVLAGGGFGRSEEALRWRPKEGLFDADEDESDWRFGGFEWLGRLLAAFGEIALWLLLAGVAIGVLATLLGGERRAPPERAPPEAPARLFGLDLDRDSLPDDVAAAARAAWARGEPALALSLLYRGALVALVDGAALRVPDSATELECVGLVRGARPGVAATFESLTDAWLRARYADAPPRDDAFHALCDHFDRVFGTAAP